MYASTGRGAYLDGCQRLATVTLLNTNMHVILRGRRVVCLLIRERISERICKTRSVVLWQPSCNQHMQANTFDSSMTKDRKCSNVSSLGVSCHWQSLMVDDQLREDQGDEKLNVTSASCLLNTQTRAQASSPQYNLMCKMILSLNHTGSWRGAPGHKL